MRDELLERLAMREHRADQRQVRDRLGRTDARERLRPVERRRRHRGRDDRACLELQRADRLLACSRVAARLRARIGRDEVGDLGGHGLALQPDPDLVERGAPDLAGTRRAPSGVNDERFKHVEKLLGRIGGRRDRAVGRQRAQLASTKDATALSSPRASARSNSRVSSERAAGGNSVR